MLLVSVETGDSRSEDDTPLAHSSGQASDCGAGALQRSAGRTTNSSRSAIGVVPRSPEASVILAMLPDTGERYFTTFLFEGMNEGSDEEPG